MVVLSGVLAVTLFLSLCPSIEETRRESRIERAYQTACSMANRLAEGDLRQSDVQNELDPWGTPYRVKDEIDGLVVISHGPNPMSSANVDHYYIHSGMDESPMKIVNDSKRRRFLHAVTYPVIWLLGVLVWFTIKIGESQRRNAA